MFSNSYKSIQKINIIAPAFLMIFILGCSSVKNKKSQTSNFPGEEADSLVASIERTACFGRCPVYSVKFYKSGYVMYEGNINVKNIGRFFTYIDQSELISIGTKAEELGYFELNDEYRNPHLTDFPTVYTEVRFRGKRKKITHYDSEVPINLTLMEDYLDSKADTTINWQVHPDQNYKD